MIRPIGEIIAPVFAKALAEATEMYGVQVLLSACETDAERKICIMGWLEQGHIDEAEASLLIEAHMLEAA